MDPGGPVLVVDDNATFRDAARLVLEAAGFPVACAADGREALDYLGRHGPPLLILLDLNMPVLDGGGFRQEQRRVRAWGGVPVVLVSSEADVGRQAAALGVAGYFRKPVEFGELLTLVRGIVGRPPAR